MNPRLRIGAAPPCRTPCSSRMSAFKNLVSGFVENPKENVIVLDIGTSFDSLREVYDLYNLYYLEKEFGIRYGKSRHNNSLLPHFGEQNTSHLSSTLMCTTKT